MNTLQRSFSRTQLELVFREERRRLLRSSFGADRQTGTEFESRLAYEFYRLRERVFGRFKPDGLLAIAKPKPKGGNRILCVPTIADRMIQFAVLASLRPKLAERGLLNSVSYGLIRSAGRGVKDARNRALALRATRPWVYKADIEKFFDNVPRDAVKKVVGQIVTQRSLHNVILAFVDTEIDDGFDPNWRKVVSEAGIVSGKGVRQGMPLSPYFAGMVLLELDRQLERRKFPAIRYVDDIIAFFSSEAECYAFHKFISRLLDGLKLKVGGVGSEGSKTTIYAPSKAADFIGMEIAPLGDGTYCLQISDACIEKIGSKFSYAGSIDKLLRKGITLPRLGGHLDAMEHGYLQAYSGAQNHKSLVAEVRVMKAAALNSALEEALGEKVSTLSKRQRRFLGLQAL